MESSRVGGQPQTSTLMCSLFFASLSTIPFSSFFKYTYISLLRIERPRPQFICFDLVRWHSCVRLILFYKPPWLCPIREHILVLENKLNYEFFLSLIVDQKWFGMAAVRTKRNCWTLMVIILRIRAIWLTGLSNAPKYHSITIYCYYEFASFMMRSDVALLSFFYGPNDGSIHR